MRQVPQYLIIGNGRMARHFQYYLSLLNLPQSHWYRGQSLEDLEAAKSKATHILALISDRAIEIFIKEHLQNTQAIIIHCSGSLIINEAFGAHPLMTFGPSLYEDQQYQQIPFVIDANAPEFEKLLPGLSNPHARLDPSLKTKYHALCVLAGNFSCMLWQKMFRSFEQELKLPNAIGHSYLKQQTQNLLKNFESALTGPLTRNDETTINKNLNALHNDPFQKVYQSFVECYKELS